MRSGKGRRGFGTALQQSAVPFFSSSPHHAPPFPSPASRLSLPPSSEHPPLTGWIPLRSHFQCSRNRYKSAEEARTVPSAHAASDLHMSFLLCMPCAARVRRTGSGRHIRSPCAPAGPVLHSSAPLEMTASPASGYLGRLDPATPVTVIEKKGDKVKVRVSGRALKDYPSQIFRDAGLRIQYAAFDEDGAEKSVQGNAWQAASAEGWVPPAGLTQDLDGLWKKAEVRHADACSTCHGAPKKPPPTPPTNGRASCPSAAAAPATRARAPTNRCSSGCRRTPSPCNTSPPLMRPLPSTRPA